MNQWIKVILPDGTEKYVRKIEFDHGFMVSHKDSKVSISNIDYKHGTDYEFAKNIYVTDQLDIPTSIKSRWKYAYVYSIHNKSNQNTVYVPLPINTIWPISHNIMREDLSDVIVVDENGNVLPWYFDNKITTGEFNIVVKLDLPPNETKRLYVLFGNPDCIGVFKKPSNTNIVKLPFILSEGSNYKIYPIDDTSMLLKWTTIKSESYIDVSELKNNEVFVIEVGNGLQKDTFSCINTKDAISLQYLSPVPQTTTNVHVQILRPKVLTYPYIWYFSVTNLDSSKPIKGPICIEFDSSELIARGLTRTDCGDIRVIETNAYGQPIQQLDYYLEFVTVGSDKTRIWVDVTIPPNNTIYLALVFGQPLSTNESKEDIFDFGDELRVEYPLPTIEVEPLPNGVYKVIVHNTTDKLIEQPIKLPIKAPNKVFGYSVEIAR